MAWLSQKWPALISIIGFVVVTAMIWSEISVQDIGNSTTDEDAYGMAFTGLIIIWWGYFIAVAVVTWCIACGLRSRSIWLLLFAPTVAVWFVNQSIQIASSEITIWDAATGFLGFTAVAALPILLGAGSHISGRILNLRYIKSAVN